MSVEFDEPELSTPARFAKKRLSPFIIIILKTGLVKTETGAQIVLLALAGILIVVSAILFMQSNAQPPVPTPEDSAFRP